MAISTEIVGKTFGPFVRDYIETYVTQEAIWDRGEGRAAPRWRAAKDELCIIWTSANLASCGDSGRIGAVRPLCPVRRAARPPWERSW